VDDDRLAGVAAPGPTWVSPRAWKKETTSSLTPTAIGPAPTGTISRAENPVSSTSSREAAPGSVSPASTSPTRPAGSSTTRLRTAGRHCSTSSSRASSVIATMTTIPVMLVRITYSQPLSLTNVR
jgi:hypothetical protein